MRWLCIFAEQIENLLPGDAANLHTFVAPVFAALDSNSGFWGFQKIGEELDQGFIGAVFDGGSAEANFQRATEGAGDFVFAGPRLHADIEGQRSPGGVFGDFKEAHVGSLLGPSSFLHDIQVEVLRLSSSDRLRMTGFGKGLKS